MRTQCRAPLAFATTLAAASLLCAEGNSYFLGHMEKFVNIQFESETELETIVGTSNQASGEVHLDLDKGTGSVSVTVPVASLTTGIDMRDDHMRSPNWLDAAQFPDISFKSTKVKLDKSKGTAEVTGDFTMHGKSKEITVTATWKAIPGEAAAKAKFPPGEWAKFSTEFEVKLGDFGVDAGKAAGKVSETWKIRLSMFGSTAKPEKK